MFSKDPLGDMKRSEALRAKEAAENVAAQVKARQTGGSVVFIASDGCEVTVTTGGHVFHNISDWY